MLNVTNNPLMLSVIMLNVANNPLMLSVIRLNDVLLYVVAPHNLTKLPDKLRSICSPWVQMQVPPEGKASLFSGRCHDTQHDDIQHNGTQHNKKMR